MSPPRKPVKQDSDYAVVLFALGLVACFVLMALFAMAIFSHAVSLPGIPSPSLPGPTIAPGHGTGTPAPATATPSSVPVTPAPVHLTPTPTPVAIPPPAAVPASITPAPSPLPATPTSLPAVQLSPDVAYVSDSATKTVYTLDSNTGTLTPAFKVDFSPGKCIVSKDGTRAYIASGKTLEIVDPRSGSVVDSMSFDQGISLMDVTRDGSMLVVYTSGDDRGGVVASIETATGRLLKSVSGVPSSWGMAISHGNVLYLGDYFNCQLAVVSLGSDGGYWRQKIDCASPGSYTGISYWKNNMYYDNAGCVGDVAVSPDDRYCYVSRWSSSKFSIVNMSTFGVDREVTMPGRSSAGVAVSPDGQRVYVTDHDGRLLLVYDAAGNPVGRFTIKPEPMKVAISGNGQHVVVLYEGSGMSLVDTATGAMQNYDIAGPGVWFPAYN